MKKCIYSFAAVLFLALSCVLTSCESKNEKLIVGEWKLSDGLNMWNTDLDVLSERWIFDEDGYFQILDLTITPGLEEPLEWCVGQGGWSIESESERKYRLVLKFRVLDHETKNFEIVTFEEEKLELRDEEGTRVLHRMK